MVSSTFADLKSHRLKVIEAIQKCGFKPNVMEFDTPRVDADVIDSSLAMVRDSAAYVGIVSRRYGQTPYCPVRNPDRLSLTELEYNEALRLDRPILLFVMGEMHTLTEADVELDSERRAKLDAFRDRAKQMREGNEVERVYEVFESVEHFSTAVTVAVARLSQFFASQKGASALGETPQQSANQLQPTKRPLLALPRYLGSHAFVGRAAELQTITDWCAAPDPNPILLFEAIGGSGKSMLTWEWVDNHSVIARDDWAGRLWYSFYERGGVMVDFCRQALAYMTGKPDDDFSNLPTSALSGPLLAELEKRPWLIVLDGLERILVAYHRYDAAQLRDDDVDEISDPIGTRDPCAAIRPEDDDLLRRLASISRSKILISSRLTPLALVSRSGMPVPGVRREVLAGLRPSDAEAMMRACGVTGDSENLQAYLQTNCDCHPLVLGVLAGLINDYPTRRGDFNSWLDDSQYGGALNLAELDLAQRRSHVLMRAIAVLSPASRRLLQTIALLQGGADFDTLKAMNPHLLEEAGRPQSDAADDPKFADLAVVKLTETIRDLEKRGLMQHDLVGSRYDLHPVVRGVVVGLMKNEETRQIGRQVVSYFTSKQHAPWDEALVLDDLTLGLQIVRVLLRTDRFTEAVAMLRDDLALALGVNLGAHAELQSLLQPLFPEGWEGPPIAKDDDERSYLLTLASICLDVWFPERSWMLREQTLRLNLKRSEPDWVGRDLRSLAGLSFDANRIAEAHRLEVLALDLAKATSHREAILTTKLSLMWMWTVCGDYGAADALWTEFEGEGRPADRTLYRPGDAELLHAYLLFDRGELTESVLDTALTLAKCGRNWNTVQSLNSLYGEWLFDSNDFSAAGIVLSEAVRMARETGHIDAYSEALFALSRVQGGDKFDARAEAQRLSEAEAHAQIRVAELWKVVGDRSRSIETALRAHRWVVADGKPYTRHAQLQRVRKILTELGSYLPGVPNYAPSQGCPYPWEAEVVAFIKAVDRH